MTTNTNAHIYKDDDISIVKSASEFHPNHVILYIDDTRASISLFMEVDTLKLLHDKIGEYINETVS